MTELLKNFPKNLKGNLCICRIFLPIILVFWNIRFCNTGVGYAFPYNVPYSGLCFFGLL